MKINNDNGISKEIEALANMLDEGMNAEKIVVDREQIGILRKLLARSAADQMLIVSLQRRLKRYTEAGVEIEAEVERMFGKIRAHAAGEGADESYDYEGARAARAAFVRDVEQTARSKDILIATLGLAVRLAPFL